ncbi:hypothetical protein HII31_04988 [Pseudocercospora fuligena]|uniref:Uncharacterized protein n=1 Tax=Pseudocercospora fuligena TaxID=685502 RepID=A0A8H6RN16_9PEZI|nr:hypothetical protein HII31_04988 [Pseudocercospora fuligena]
MLQMTRNAKFHVVVFIIIAAFTSILLNSIISITPYPRQHQVSHHALLTRQQSNDANNGNPTWLPDNTKLLLSDARIDQLWAENLITTDERNRLKAAKKGFALLCSMKASTATSPTDPKFLPNGDRTSQDILDEYGWKQINTRNAQDQESKLLFESLTSAFDGLGVSNDKNSWIQNTAEHSITKPGYPATHGKYQNYFDLSDGAMIAASNWSPEMMVLKEDLDIDDDEVVPLRRWSDVVWNSREDVISINKNQESEVKKIEHVFRHNIASGATQNVIRMVADVTMPEKLGEWPGLSYPISEPQALALLSSPNAYGLAWFLIQHKSSMGIRYIDRINIFDCKVLGQSRWCMYLHIADA